MQEKNGVGLPGGGDGDGYASGEGAYGMESQSKSKRERSLPWGPLLPGASQGSPGTTSWKEIGAKIGPGHPEA